MVSIRKKTLFWDVDIDQLSPPKEPSPSARPSDMYIETITREMLELSKKLCQVSI
jgi:hypothetical protein